MHNKLEKSLTQLTLCDNISIKVGDIMFSEKLKELRSNNKLTQAQFAEIFNISYGTVAMWETGRRTPDIETIKKIANYFSISIDYLVDNNSEHNQNGLNKTYFNIAKKMQDSNMDPEDLMNAYNLIEQLKNKKSNN